MAGNTTATTGSVYTFAAAGDGLGYSYDTFHFMYRKMSGDGTIIARVASLQNAASGAKAGVMIREKIASSSAHASVLLTGAGTAAFARRLQTEGDTSWTTVNSISAPTG